MKKQTLIFLKPFSIKNPTLDEQNDFMMTEIVNEVECAGLGRIYNNGNRMFRRACKAALLTDKL